MPPAIRQNYFANATAIAHYLSLFEQRVGGGMYWPKFSELCAPWLQTTVEVLRERNWILGRMHGPTPVDVSNVSAACAAGVRAAQSLGHRYFGVSTIENGARYLNTASANAATAQSSSAAQSYVQAEYLDAYAALIETTGYYVLSTSTSDQQPWLASGQATLLSTESAQSYGNDQVNYAFNRGAAKHYGVHLGAGVSVGTPVGPSSLSLIKRILFTEILYGSLIASVELGVLDNKHAFAVTALGRLQNATRNFFLSLAQNGPARSQPLGGYVHLTTTAIMHDTGSGWEMPCMGPQREPQYPFRRLRNLPWARQDYLLDGVLNLTFPGYGRGGFNLDQSGYISRTPFGDATDVLTDDAPSWLLPRYDLIVVTSSLSSTPRASARRLAAAMAQGAHVVLSADAMATLSDAGVAEPLFGASALAGRACQSFSAGTSIQVTADSALREATDGTAAKIYVEPASFTLCPLQNATATAGAGSLRLDTWHVIASEPLSGVAAAVRLSSSAGPATGTLTILLAGQFATADAPAMAAPNFTCPSHIANTVRDFEPDRPFPMVQHARAVVSDMMRERALFEVDGADARTNHLAWLTLGVAESVSPGTAVMAASTGDAAAITRDYILAISNPSMSAQPFSIRAGPGLGSSSASINVSEIPVDGSERREPGFAPANFSAEDARDPTVAISGGAVRVFRVRVSHHKAEGVEVPLSSSAPTPGLPTPPNLGPAGPAVLPQMLAPAAATPRGRWLRMSAAGVSPDLRAAVVSRPSLSLYFDGLLLDWHYVYGRDDDALQQDGRFAASRRLQLGVDLTSAIAPFPHWRLCNDSDPVGAEDYARSVQGLYKLLDKAVTLAAKHVHMSLHDGDRACMASMQHTLATFSTAARAVGVQVHVRHCAKGPSSNFNHLESFLSKAGACRVAPSLALVLDDPRPATVVQQVSASMQSRAPNSAAWLLLSTTAKDDVGSPHTHFAPMAALTSTQDATTLVLLRLANLTNVTLVFDAAFTSHDEEQLDWMKVTELLRAATTPAIMT